MPVSEASRGLFDVCSGVGASSRGRLLAESLGAVLTEERRTKRMHAEGNSKEDRYKTEMGTYSGSLRRR